MILPFLKHPFPVKARFRNYFLVNFAVDPRVLQALLPKPLTPTLHNGSAFLAVVIADMEKMRPVFLPSAFGINYRQVAYRAVVTCRGERGVHFLRSDANNRFMCMMGNAMSYYRFHYAHISHTKTETTFRYDLTSRPDQCADIHAQFDLTQSSRNLPSSSRFATLAEAQQFLVELYTAYIVDGDALRTLRVKRGDLDINVVSDTTQIYQFMQNSCTFPKGSAQIDSIFHIGDLFYDWCRMDRPSQDFREIKEKAQ